MSPAIALLLARVVSPSGAGEEGERLYAYDDATGLRVKAPVGNLTWGIGFNIDVCGSHELFVTMFEFLAGKIETQIESFPWYIGQPPGVQSVCLDIAFNGGVHDLLNYPHMLGFLVERNYAGAAAQCTTTNPKLQGRYKALASILASGR